MIGIISAMQEEIQALHTLLKNEKIIKKGMRTYYYGILFDQEIVLVFSRWGKVASATTATQIINDFNVDEIIFTGVAGSIQKEINIGDIIVGKNLYQHDMNASPLVEQFEIPILQKKYFETNTVKRDLLYKACQLFLIEFENFIDKSNSIKFNITSPKVLIEDIASGDQFISTKQQISYIKNTLPNIACVEMEGAAVAQVCFEYQVPFSIIRTISDNANNNSHIDFPKFAKIIASNYALGILKHYFNLNSNT
ncbi:MAG: 5'-methylthioadenosine/adenosylhomocysteine nucleosidase [Flavobacteriaceae bacterium]|nr:5'-methylthioadenosine/adenosylhomocysteine nucleosidase [Flavobacteriaceae bacterium]